jgi:signal transduction histidine kinase
MNDKEKLKTIEKDNTFIPITVDSGLINRLGEELVARQETAVSELIKNSYDADATEVKVVFYDAEKLGGTLTISDNGVGMTKDQIINGFMRISSDSKIKNPLTPVFKRKVAGKKGIGRFAVHKLGGSLKVITQSATDENSWELYLDWSKYQSGDNLSEVMHELKKIEKQKTTGTTLEINQLKATWNESEIKRVYRYVIDILQPDFLFPFDKDKKSNSVKNNSPFKVSCYTQSPDNEPKVLTNEKIMIFDQAVAEFEGFVDEEGNGFCAVTNATKLSSIKEVVDQDIINISSTEQGIATNNELADIFFDKYEPYSTLRNIHFKVYYFLIDNEFIPGNQIQATRQFLNEQGGVKIYHNGFRVLPYGEVKQGDDWLGLDQSTRRRSILPTHANLNFYGFVQITDNDEQFKQTSNREKFIESELAFKELRDFTYKAIVACTIKIAHARNIKVASTQKKLDIVQKDTKNEVRAIFATLLDSEQGKKIEKIITDAQKAIEKNFNKLIIEQQNQQKEALKELEMLRVLSSLGLNIAEFIHEMKQYIPAFENGTALLAQKIQDAQLKKIIDSLHHNSTLFRSYLGYFDAAIAANVSRELVVLDINKEIYKFQQAIKADADRNNLTIKVEPKVLGAKIAPIHISELSSILLNLYSNAKKALYRKKPTTKNILIQIDATENTVLIAFCDNGDGISEKNKSLIFDAFFTTSSPAGQLGDDNTELLGTGLGLKIVKDIIQSRGGKVYVSDNLPTNMATCICIEFKKY